MERREDRKQRVRQEILQAALGLYRQRGVDETRVQDIIEQVGISEKTFFNYFPSKQAILEVSAGESLRLYQALLEYELAMEDRTVSDRLDEIVGLWAEAFAADREFQAEMVSRTSIFFGASGSMRDQQQATQRLLADLFRQGQLRGEISRDHDAVQLAELLTASLLLTTINWLDRWWGEVDQTLQKRLEHALGVFLEGAKLRS